MNETEWREALYRQLARQPGLPAGLRPELIKLAESCASRLHLHVAPAYVARRDVEGCKGAISR
ncbi:hypothetical protein HJG53_12010 [Sphingomonas sp. ID1715]|uniref:hypothetical protein n=1 Tax=Sphingomonas sp. ID1715 TaxID=1656898 RepID=UPI0014878F49|nr:hypothetical protein [Sphingomonas sp. ID1715]NNM77634.1 hypothetical protein [Sphingomonas sp. ID1715]